MPLAAAEAAERRVVRAARWAGLTAARSGDVDCNIQVDLVELVPADDLPDTCRDRVVEAARGGLARGLGLSTQVVDRLSEADRLRLKSWAEQLADRLLGEIAARRVHPVRPAPVDQSLRRMVDVALIASTAADVPVLHDVALAVEAAGFTCVPVDVEYVDGEQGATGAWRAIGREPVGYNALPLRQVVVRMVLARRPAGPAVLELLAQAGQLSAIGRFLAEPSRFLEVEESPSALSDVESCDTSQCVALLKPVAEPTGVIDRWQGSRFPTLIAKEESNFDEAGAEQLMRLRNLHAGETVVVIGNGPSLNQIDMSLLRGVPTFGVNSIFLMGDRLVEPISYYVVEDTLVFKENLDDVKRYQAKTKLFPSLYKNEFSPEEIGDNTIFFRMNQGFYGRNTGTLCHPRFSTNCVQRLFCGQSVTIINLQLAYWMGFSRVVLIGMDFSYVVPPDATVSGSHILSNSDDHNHFHPDYFGKGKTWKDPKLDRVLINYRLANEMYRASGREIINATVGGHLEVFPRMPLAEAVGRG
jgi:hypothetical protein